MTASTEGSRLSRRSLVKTAATAAAAAGGALAVAGPASPAAAAALPAAPPARVPEQYPSTGDGVLVRVLDVRLGTLEVYTRTGGHHTVTDRALAAQLARLAR
jgi:hypothetical protein